MSATIVIGNRFADRMVDALNSLAVPFSVSAAIQEALLAFDTEDEDEMQEHVDTMAALLGKVYPKAQPQMPTWIPPDTKPDAPPPAAAPKAAPTEKAKDRRKKGKSQSPKNSKSDGTPSSHPVCSQCGEAKPARWIVDGVCSRCRGDLKARQKSRNAPEEAATPAKSPPVASSGGRYKRCVKCDRLRGVAAFIADGEVCRSCEKGN